MDEQAASAASVKQAPPCTLVIFGGGGDLTKRLLMPSLYNLSTSKRLPDAFSILGVDRVQQDDGAWRTALTETMQSFTKDKTAEFYTPKLDEAAWGWVADRLHYLSGDFGEDKTFADIAKAIGDGSAVFYLAVAARFFGTVVDGLGKAGLLKQPDGRFRHVVIEKPFGSDLPSAQALNARILKQADESQFYRIDHFLGKETVQSIMAVRFANGMFEPTWRREYIDHVQITAAETVGVEERGAFYEPTGALRDMVPNHMFTLLCMVAMEPPNSFDAEDVRTEKAKLVRGDPAAAPGRGRAGPVRRRRGVRGGRFRATATSRTWPRTATPRPMSRCGCDRELALVGRAVLPADRQAHGRPQHGNLHPLQARAVSHVSRHAGGGDDAERGAPADRSRRRASRRSSTPRCRGRRCGSAGSRPRCATRTSSRRQPNVGYETLLYDCMTGDATLFQRADNIEASWRAVQPLLEAWGRGEGERGGLRRRQPGTGLRRRPARA